MSSLFTATRDWLDEKREDGRLLPSLVRRAPMTFIGAAVLLVAVEAVAALLSHLDVRRLQWITTKLEPDKYETLVAAVVGAEVFFLAIFYATVGVIASTSYQSVPGEIRQLFVQERSSRLFTRSVVRALVVGVLVLAMGAIGYKPYGLTLLALLTLTAFSILSMVVLGTDLFSFFDLSSLAKPLPRRFARALRRASAADGKVPDAVGQRFAHRKASDVLRYYRQLSALLVSRKTDETAAPQRVLYQLIEIAELNSAGKASVPSNSEWYARIPSHRNWLTLDHSRLGIALQTRTGVQPDLVPDHLWVEREIAARIQDLLPLLLTTPNWPAAIEIADALTRVITSVALRLQTEEARLLHNVLATCLREAVAVAPRNDPRTDVEHAAGTLRTFRLAAAERSILALTSRWLGFTAAARSVSASNLKTSWDRAVADPTSPYAIGAPRDMLSVLEEIAAGIALETGAEGHRVTPAWWVHHYAARSLVRQLLADRRRLLDDMDEVVSQVEATSIEDETELGIVMAFDALELVAKAQSHLPVVEHAIEELTTLRSERTGDDLWPELQPLPNTADALEDRLLRYLAKASLNLDPDPHDPARPDLFGQAYKVLFDACFNAILDALHDLARALFPAVVFAADRARRRLVDDLADQGLQARFIFATEPLVDLMELSGYAMLIQELNGAGVWDEVERIWNGILRDDVAPALAEQMAVVLKQRESIFALTQGGIERTSRKMLLNQLLRGRGIVESHYWSPFEKEKPLSHSSVIVRTFAPDEMGSFEELADLFLVEYLIKQPGCDHFELSHRATSLRDQLERERNREDASVAVASDPSTDDVSDVDVTQPPREGTTQQ